MDTLTWHGHGGGGDNNDDERGHCTSSELVFEPRRRGAMGNGRESDEHELGFSRGLFVGPEGATWRPSMARAPWMAATPLFCEQRKGETGVGGPACLAGAS